VSVVDYGPVQALIDPAGRAFSPSDTLCSLLSIYSLYLFEFADVHSRWVAIDSCRSSRGN
jgi:hypothetical protein